MSNASQTPRPIRPNRVTPTPAPPVPEVDTSNADAASVAYSHYRTGLSNHRTGLSEHRTDLSEFRTDLSTERTEMSMRRTGMSFHRTRMSADRTLVSVIRTALSLIGFGFTIYQGFQKLHEAGAIASAAAPRNFGIMLALIGIGMLTIGIVNHALFMTELRHTRSEMTGEALIHGESRFPVSLTLITAIALLLLGLVAVASMVLKVSLFG